MDTLWLGYARASVRCPLSTDWEAIFLASDARELDRVSSRKYRSTFTSARIERPARMREHLERPRSPRAVAELWGDGSETEVTAVKLEPSSRVLVDRFRLATRDDDVRLVRRPRASRRRDEVASAGAPVMGQFPQRPARDGPTRSATRSAPKRRASRKWQLSKDQRGSPGASSRWALGRAFDAARVGRFESAKRPRWSRRTRAERGR